MIIPKDKLKRTENKGGNDSRGKDADRKRASRAEGRDVGLHPHTRRLAQKKKLEYNLRAFLLYTFPEQMYLEFSDDHLEMIQTIQECIFDGGNLAEALPRGSGKTTIVRGSIIWALGYGHRRYIATITSTGSSAKKILKGIKKAFQFNQRLDLLFPEITHYVRALGGQSQSATGQLANGQLTNMSWTTEQLVFPAFKPNEKYLERCNQSVLEARGLTGEVRGMQYETMDGRILRPDFVFLDDPQTKESAKSTTQTGDRIELIEADVLGLAGPDVDIACIATCTVICEGDLAQWMLKKWRSKLAKLLYVLPDAHATLWKEYINLRLDNKNEAPKVLRKICNGFYKENRPKMDAGAVVGWEQRILKGDLSALQTAYNLLAKHGETAFYSEFQNEPQKVNADVYTISPDLLLERVNNYRKREAPTSGHFKIATADINFHGVSWVNCNFENDYTCSIADYGVYTKKGKQAIYANNWEMTEALALFEALKSFCDLMARRFPELRILGIDGNRFTKPVVKFVKAYDGKFPFRLYILRGYSPKKYKTPATSSKTLIGKSRQRCHLQKNERQDVNDIPFDSSFWHMTSQKAFLRSPGAPGSASFYSGENVRHREICEHICADKLVDYYERNGELIYDWKKVPGKNDLGDSLAMAYVLANIAGLELDGIKMPKRKVGKKKSRAKVVNRKRR